MQPLSLKEVTLAVNGLLVKQNGNVKISSITTHITRVKKGSLFILPAHRIAASEKLVKAVWTKGAAAVILPNQVNCAVPQIIVKSTKKALMDLYRFYRCQFNIPVIGITGSAGKTSTKDMLSSVLKQKFKVRKTPTTFNTFSTAVGTTLGINSSTGAAIFELGFGGKYGKIKKMAYITDPTIGIITNISTGHYRIPGSRENIMKAKLEMTHYFDDNSLLIINADDEYLSKIENTPYRVIKISTQGKGDYNAYDITNQDEGSIDFKCSIDGEVHSFRLNTVGAHFVYSALACIAVGRLLGVDAKQIKQGIAKFKPHFGRTNVIKLPSGVRIINDCYNANLISMKAAVDTIHSLTKGRKIIVLGDMLQQGRDSEKFHRELGKYVIDKCDLLCTVGKNSKYIFEEAKSFITAKHFETKQEAFAYLSCILKANDIILIKGSRGVHMESLVKSLKTLLRKKNLNISK